jgi:hypothetical protein
MPQPEEQRKQPQPDFWGCAQAIAAQMNMEAKRLKSAGTATDESYANCLAIRSVPFKAFLDDGPQPYPITISSVKETHLLIALGVSRVEQQQIQGLTTTARGPAYNGSDLMMTSKQLVASAIVRLAANPPPAVGVFQRRATSWLVRPYPLGARFSGNNMSPLPCWLSGSQSAALNMTNNDLAIHLHFALFDGSDGYVIKPVEMLQCGGDSEATDPDDYWPPPSRRLHTAAIELISLHTLPKHGEQRPRLEGSRSACHQYHPELSGASSPPNTSKPSTFYVTVSLHPIGGIDPYRSNCTPPRCFCAPARPCHALTQRAV